jgi:type IV secretion system protein VirD4
LLEYRTLITTGILFAVGFIFYFALLVKSRLIGFRSTIERTDATDSRMYGNSEWQTQKEIDINYKKINWKDIYKTPDAQGFIVNSRKDKSGNVTVNRTYEKHALIVAATRVGKSKNFISPNIQFLSNCPNKPSMFITDPKGELLAENGANLQKNGYTVIVLNLREPTKSHKYNPLGLIWDFYHEYKKTGNVAMLDEAEALLRELAVTIAPIEGAKEPTWDLGAQNIIQGLCLAMLEDSDDPKYCMTKDKFTLWQIMNLLSQGSDLLRDFCLRRPKTSPSIIKTQQYVDNAAKETIGSYISTTTTKLNVYVDSGMTHFMSDTELKLDEIAQKPTAIFCVVPDENRSRHPLATLITSQIYKYLIYLANKNAEIGGAQALPNDFYFILDEFGNFPKMPCVQEMLSIGGGRKIWTCIVIQAISQLYEKYRKDLTSTLLNNLSLQVYMGAPELETNKFFSEFFGSRTIRKNSVALSSADLTKDLQGNTQMEKEALINPDELSRLPFGEIVFKVYKDQPARTKLIPIFDKTLQEKGVFNVGKPNVTFIQNHVDKDSVFYDLTERDNKYDNIADSQIKTLDVLNFHPLKSNETFAINTEEKHTSTQNTKQLKATVEKNNLYSVIDFINTIKSKVEK